MPLNKPWFSHLDIANGGRLVLNIGTMPNKAWGAARCRPAVDDSVDGYSGGTPRERGAAGLRRRGAVAFDESSRGLLLGTPAWIAQLLRVSAALLTSALEIETGAAFGLSRNSPASIYFQWKLRAFLRCSAPPLLRASALKSTAATLRSPHPPRQRPSSFLAL
jgi:hypothetical protein